MQYDKRFEGPIAFQGLATPGGKIILKVAGRQNQYVNWGASIANDKGEFGILARFNAGLWRLRFELFTGETVSKPAKILEYPFRVYPKESE